VTLLQSVTRMLKHTIRLFLEYDRAVARRLLGQKDLGNFQVKSMYESKDFVDHYIRELELQPPEAEVLEELRGELPKFKMLDIGVGAGRTTQHFAKLVKEYIGIDYSKTMIDACRVKFPQYRLEVADARNLSIFDDSYFDFALFSFNGLDAVEHEERLKILHEIRRIIRKGGYFCFSTLNLNSRRGRPPVTFYKNPLLTSFDIYNFLLNGNFRNKKINHDMIFLKYRDFLTRLYFITPAEMLKQLSEAGFSQTKAYNLDSGKEIGDPITMLDYWVYFLTIAN
jgi:ubiquinone/menaquinone biosynthesis C-methylase UbiE